MSESPAISVKCPQCERSFRIRSHNLGREVRCTDCSTLFISAVDHRPSPPPLPSSRQTKNFWPYAVLLSVVIAVPLLGFAARQVFSQRDVSAETVAVPPAKQVIESNPVNEAEVIAKKSVTSLLEYTFFTVKFMRYQPDGQLANARIERWNELRNAIPDLGSDGKVDAVVDAMGRGLQVTVALLKQKETEPISAERDQATRRILESLESVVECADVIARKLHISHDDAHGSIRFHEKTTDFLAEAHRALDVFNGYKPSQPQPELEKECEAIALKVREIYLQIPDPPLSIRGRESYVSGLKGIHETIVTAAKLYLEMKTVIFIAKKRNEDNLNQSIALFYKQLRLAGEFIDLIERLRATKSDQMP